MVHSHRDREAIPHHVLDANSLTRESVHDKTLSEEHIEL